MENDFVMHPDANNEVEWLSIVLPKIVSGEFNIAECGQYRIARLVDGNLIVSEKAMAAIARLAKD